MERALELVNPNQMVLEPWQIRLLGEISARRSSHSVTRFSTRHAAALLGFLAYHIGRPQPRGYLAELLWPDAEPQVARSRLRVALASLRRQLEPPGTPSGFVIWSSREMVCLRSEACEVDVSMFRSSLRRTSGGDAAGTLEALSEADSLYKGELMPAHSDDWIIAARLELSELQIGVQLRLSRLLESSGDADRALRHARKAVAADPLLEGPRGVVLRLLMDRGERGAAEAEFADFRRVAKLITGGEPSGELRAMLLREGTRASQGSKGAELTPERPQPAEYDAGVRPEPTRPAPALIRPPGEFVGREADLDLLQGLLQVARVLTLTGPPGVGKTRLAIEAAIRASEGFGAGIQLIEAEEVARGATFLERLLEGLGVPNAGPEHAMPRLREILRSRAIPGTKTGFLLLVDGAESLLGERVAELGTLVREVPAICLLVSSQRKLQLLGEQEFQVLPLPTPGESPTEWQSLTRNDSVRLFLDRAQNVQPDFQLNERNAPHVAEVCRSCEGIPLALELVAAAVRRAPLSALREQIGTARKGRPALTDALERCWSNLPQPLADAMIRLTVFPGSWDLEAGAAVLGERGQEAMGELSERSLLARETSAGRYRYRMLEAIRRFFASRANAGALADAAMKHAHHFLGRAELFRAAVLTCGPWRQNGLSGEHGNLERAFQWFIEEGRMEDGARFVLCLGLYFYCVCSMREGRRWIALISLPEPGTAEEYRMHAWLKMSDALLACQMDDGHAALARSEEGLDLVRRFDTPEEAVRAGCIVGFANYGIGAYQAAEERFRAWIDVTQKKGFKWSEGAFRNLLGFALIGQERLDEALREFQACVELCEYLDDDLGIAHALLGFARIAWIREDWERAKDLYTRCLAAAAKCGNSRACAFAAQGLARVFAGTGIWDRAAQAFGIGQRIRDEQGMKEDASDRLVNSAAIGQVRQELGERFDLLWQIGREMPHDSAIEWLCW